MIIDMNYWTKVIKKLLVFIFSIICIYLCFKLALFYIPFLIAFIISLFIEPIIRFCMKKFKWKRKTSAIIVFIVVLLILISFLILGIVTLISESSKLLSSLNIYVEKISVNINDFLSNINLDKYNLSNDIINIIKNSGNELIDEGTEFTKNLLQSVLNFITSIPTIGIYLVITILSLYFICTDKIYMIDQFEHHMPELWVKKIVKHLKDIIKSLGGYLKAQVTLVIISFIICLIGLFLFKIFGLNVGFPLLAALGIAFVDALPIFGSATVMIPWAVISAFNGDIKLSICLIILLVIMSITRQIMEPKVVSGKLGVHPIFTLVAMYTGFKIIGIIGMLIGPIILIILKNIYSNMIDRGFAKAIFEREM